MIYDLLTELEIISLEALKQLEHAHNYTALLNEIRPKTTYQKLQHPTDIGLCDEEFVKAIERSESVERQLKQDFLKCYDYWVDLKGKKKFVDQFKVMFAVKDHSDSDEAHAVASCPAMAKWEASRICLFNIIDQMINFSPPNDALVSYDSDNATTSTASRPTTPILAKSSSDYINVTTFYANKIPNSSFGCSESSQTNNETLVAGEVNEDNSEIIVGDRSVVLMGKGPMAILNEVFPNLNYEMLLERAKSAQETFTCRIRLNGNVYDGHGRSKKLARSNAAHAVLGALYGLRFAFQQKRHVHDPRCNVRSFESSQMDTQQFADAISLLVKRTFESLSSDDPTLQRRKVLAGIVMTKSDEDLQTGAQVICVTTGTKCINAENLRGNGQVLRDCHAEIIARRCLVLYLMEMLHVYITTNNGIFEQAAGGKLRLKDEISFHLYVSTSPCGDARVFSIHEGECNDGNDVHPNRKARGQLRKKIEAGEGTVLITPGSHIQTCDGIVSGEPLQTMSCSDKICRWNIIGVQGSLLSVFIEPVYLSTIAIGTLFHSDHLKRAMYGRIEQLTDENLPNGFCFHRPVLIKASLCLPRLARKAPFHSFIWYNGISSFRELINSENGLKEDYSSSRLSRRSLFEYWKYLCTDFKLSQHSGLIYGDAKLLADGYREAKSMAIRAFSSAGLGLWIRRPLEQDLFD
ncbi:hypothetical protein ACOME3_005709 [Neoechinorhynchus agilis]